MNRDVIRARELIAENAQRSLEQLRRLAQGEKIEGDPKQIADGVENAIRTLVRVPADVIE